MLDRRCMKVIPDPFIQDFFWAKYLTLIWTTKLNRYSKGNLSHGFRTQVAGSTVWSFLLDITRGGMVRDPGHADLHRGKSAEKKRLRPAEHVGDCPESTSRKPWARCHTFAIVRWACAALPSTNRSSTSRTRKITTDVEWLRETENYAWRKDATGRVAQLPCCYLLTAHLTEEQQSIGTANDDVTAQIPL